MANSGNRSGEPFHGEWNQGAGSVRAIDRLNALYPEAKGFPDTPYGSQSCPGTVSLLYGRDFSHLSGRRTITPHREDPARSRKTRLFPVTIIGGERRTRRSSGFDRRLPGRGPLETCTITRERFSFLHRVSLGDTAGLAPISDRLHVRTPAFLIHARPAPRPLLLMEER
jgi:hypothetical protein